jgi:hypothetical protein
MEQSLGLDWSRNCLLVEVWEMTLSPTRGGVQWEINHLFILFLRRPAKIESRFAGFCDRPWVGTRKAVPLKSGRDGEQTRKEAAMVTVKDLKKLDIFGVLSDKQLTDLSKITEKKSYQTGQHLYESGDRAKRLFVVTKGCVGLRELAPGDAVGVGFDYLERGDVLGCASLMKPRRYTLSAVCQEDTEVLSIDADRLHDISEKDPELGFRLMSKIAESYMGRFEIAKRQIHQMVKTPTIIMGLPG